MSASGVEACVVTGADPHISEYVPERWQGRMWLSGFTGSAGTLVVTLEEAGLWTDSRYWEQGASELEGTGVQLMKIVGPSSIPPFVGWICERVTPGASVAVDGFSMSLGGMRALETGMQHAGLTLRTDIDLLDAVWTERPCAPSNSVYAHSAPYANRERSDKLSDLRTAMAEKGAQWHFISTLDDLGWLLNLRGSDVSYNPVFVSHALVGTDSVTLFIAEGKIPREIGEKLGQEGVRTAPYESAQSALSALPSNATLMIDPARVAYQFIRSVPGDVKVVECINPTTLFKAQKSRLDAEHIRATMEQDGAALAEVFAWLDKAAGVEEITELLVGEKLAAARADRPGFVSLSFGTIAGFNANGALPHYQASELSNSQVKGDGLLLIDSGGQYLGGTTDVTRVVPVGDITDEQRYDFTLVLKGMIALSRARFPRGTRSPMLDSIARAPLWAAGIDYGHGTGHGVGYFMNVHEGPQSISYRAAAEPWTAMDVRMVTSIEPGIYRHGKWGIRIENLVMTQPAAPSEFGDFLEFETLTLCPIDTRCIAIHMLSDDECSWIDAYHATVWERVSPHVQGQARAWLERSTRPLGR